MTIKVLEKTEGCLPKVIAIGDWIDLTTSVDITLRAPFATMLKRHRKGKEEERTREVIFDSTLIPLGICVEVPKGMESVIVPRSSTFKKYGILQSNSEGIIDYKYNSNEDEWKMPILSTRAVTIPKGTRIAQFRIQLSQKATFWQKIKWLFSNSIKIEKVDTLDNEKRGGFGSTGN